MQLWRIQAVDQTSVFLLGQAIDQNEVISSVLLRSDNGGVNWSEVLRPRPKTTDLSVAGIHLTFLKGGMGWAVGAWEMPTWGEVSITTYQTKDYGHTWTTLSNTILPKAGSASTFLKMSFSDEIHGQIDVLIENSQNDRFAYLTTRDGGMTWKETGSLLLESTFAFSAADKEAFLTAKHRYIEHNYTSNALESTGVDESRWKLELSENTSQAIIKRRLVGECDWVTINQLDAKSY